MKRIAIIGLGDAGKNHLRTLTQETDVKVVAVADAVGAVAAQQAAERGVDRWFTDYRELLKLPDLDAVIVSTPPFVRREIVVAAAEAGKDILAEKPFGISSDDARAMIDACATAGVKVMVNFGTRNLPAFQKVRELVQSGEYGRPVWAWCKYLLVSEPEIFMPPAWFWQKRTGGGHLVENAGHAIDFICELLGPVDFVSGMTTQLPLQVFGPVDTKPDIENMGAFIPHHQGGGMSVICNGCNAAGGWGMDIDILTDTSMIMLRKDRTIIVEQSGRKVFEYEAPVGWNPIPFGSRAFIRFLNGETEGKARPVDGLRAIRIAEAVYDSSSAAKSISLNGKSH